MLEHAQARWHFLFRAELKFLSKNQHSNTQPSKSASAKAQFPLQISAEEPCPLFPASPYPLFVLQLLQWNHLGEDFDLWSSQRTWIGKAEGFKGREKF